MLLQQRIARQNAHRHRTYHGETLHLRFNPNRKQRTDRTNTQGRSGERLPPNPRLLLLAIPIMERLCRNCLFLLRPLSHRAPRTRIISMVRLALNRTLITFMAHLRKVQALITMVRLRPLSRDLMQHRLACQV